MDIKKILVIDDEPLTCQLIAKVLELQGFTSVTLNNHQQTLKVVANEKPALILMDYYLGTTHGLELLQSLKKKTWASSIPIYLKLSYSRIFISGIDRSKESLNAGADAFLLKPFDWAELLTAINELLQE